MIINNNLQSITGAYCLNGKNKNKREINHADFRSAIEEGLEEKPQVFINRMPMCLYLDCANFINGPQFIGGKAKCSVYDEIPDKIFCNGGCCTSFKSKKPLKIF